MVNILLSRFEPELPWLQNALGRYLNPQTRVLVAGYSFSDACTDEQGWQAWYGEGSVERLQTERSFSVFGIKSQNIRWADFFTDTKKAFSEKLNSADVLYLPGGLPERMMERFAAKKLVSILEAFDKTVIGASAGALIQCRDYMISPDSDYREHSRHRGLSYITDFSVDVHYENNPVQNESIRRHLFESKKPVYAIPDDGGIIRDGETVTLLGNVTLFGR